MPPRTAVRDLIISLIILGLMPVCFRRPYIGLLVFSWLGYMRVQDLCWGFARDMRWSYYVALVMFAGFLVSKRERWFLPDWKCWAMIALVVLVTISAIFSEDFGPYVRQAQISRVMDFYKIIGIALFTTAICRTREHLRLLLWVVALCFAFYGIKNSIWGLRTLGQVPIIQGPGGLLHDRNNFALALAMSLPILWCLGQSERRPVLRRAFLMMVPLVAFNVLLTQSRGGLLSLIMAVGVLIFRSKHRWTAAAVGAVLALGVVTFMPEGMKSRFQTIAEYETEGSAQSRIKSWAVAYRMAIDNPVLGVGLQKFRANYMRYEPNPTPDQLAGDGIYVAHNTYLQIWAEYGTIALLIYLSLYAGSFWTLWSIRRRAAQIYHSSWILTWCTMFEAALLTFMVGSTFLNRADFDLLYHLFAMIIVFSHFARKDMEDPGAGVQQTRGRGELRLGLERGFSPLARPGARLGGTFAARGGEA